MNTIIRAQSYVTLHYRIRLDSGPGKGNIMVDTFDAQPATLVMGTGQWPETLEQPLLGLTEGDTFSYSLSAAQAFGERNPELIQPVTREMLTQGAGEQASFADGDLVEFNTSNGTKFSGYFRGFEGDNAIFDFNHPLAGIDIVVDVKIIGVM